MDKTDVEINSPKDLETWLKDKSITAHEMISLRVALRVFPFFLHSDAAFLFRIFHDFFKAWAAYKYPAYDIKRDHIDNNTTVISSKEISTKININLIWDSINLDVSRLSTKQGIELINQPLWLENNNNNKQSSLNKKLLSDLKISLVEFENTKVKNNTHWKLISNWYKSILPFDPQKKPHSFFGERADLAIATQPDEFWERGKDNAGVATVLADIAKIVDGTYEGDPSPTQKKVSQETLQPAERTDVKPKSDEPTAEDELGRRPFAESLVDKINEVREAGQKDGFAVHLHAPWGAGKTSILLMMQDYMKRSAKKETHDNNWVVVNFNAWEHERRNPPWWPLMEAVERDCSAYLAEQAGIRNNKKPWQEVDDCLKSITQSHFRSSVKSWIGHKFRWCWWKLKTDWLPLVVFLIFGCFVYFLLDKSELITNSPDQSFFMTFLKNLFPLILAAVGLYATFLSATRSMVFGSKDSANYYFQLSNDPLGRIHNLFNKLIDGVDRPVCIFIDDLDRCYADFVVDLLEGIQSSFRHEKVTYVVAADKGWIRSAFETRYDTFKDHVGDPAQPLGYLFLEKIFQMSTPIPGMAAYVKEDYFMHLLDDKTTEGNETEPVDDYHERVESAKRELEDALPEGTPIEILKQYIEKDPTPENKAAGVRILNKSAKAEKQSEHFLLGFKDILTGNPREMKRLLNAFEIRRTLWMVESSNVSLENIFRWTVIEQSYPALADLLSDRPDLIKHFETRPNKKDDNDKKIPTDLEPFYEIDAIFEIVNGLGKTTLTEEIIHDITKGYGNYS